ncbi:unnamed protein product [Lasius platythorax]|uniref:Uncharacterized protein n=1 Tax=Lasius platythorax TaxID=488582 RepID=A0AAV2NJU5_9HYME
MDTKIFALLVFVGVLGSFMEAQAAYFGYPYPYGNGQLRGPTSVNFVEMPRSKREIGDSNGETTTSQATTTTPSSTNPTTTPSSSSTTPSSTTPSSTTPSSTTPSTSPTTTPTTPTTTPTSTSATTPTTTSATTPSTTTPSTTTPESTKSTSKPKKSTDNDVQSRSNFDESEPEDSSKKPGSTSKDDKAPTPGPNYGPGVPGAGFGGFGPGFDPYFGYPGFNSIPGPGPNPNYAWTGTNNAPGYASAGASAGSFAGYPGAGYPGAGYPGAGYPGAGYPGMGYPGMGYPGPGYPMRGQQPTTTESPSVNNRGGFQDNSPSQNTPNYGGVDPYNAGPGFLFPGQFPNFNDPTFDMIKQIQAQIEAQHQANMDLHNRLANDAANYGGGSYGGGSYGVPQVASASIGLGPGGGFQAGQISPAAPGIESRFAEELPAPSGNSFGVFASSSSSSMTGPDGKPIGHKSSVTGVNDNGKISYHSVHD